MNRCQAKCVIGFFHFFFLVAKMADRSQTPIQVCKFMYVDITQQATVLLAKKNNLLGSFKRKLMWLLFIYISCYATCS